MTTAQITVDAIRKPAQVVAEATATLSTTGATADALTTEGLHALGETKPSLFGWGLRDEHGDRVDLTSPVQLSGTFTFYAHRD